MSQSLFGRVLRPAFGVLLGAALVLGAQIDAAIAQVCTDNTGNGGVATDPPTFDQGNFGNGGANDAEGFLAGLLDGSNQPLLNNPQRVDKVDVSNSGDCTSGQNGIVYAQIDTNPNNTQSGTWNSGGVPVCVVGVHAGNGTNVWFYTYAPPATSGTWTSAPNGAAISNLQFFTCDQQPSGGDGSIVLKKKTTNGFGGPFSFTIMQNGQVVATRTIDTTQTNTFVTALPITGVNSDTGLTYNVIENSPAGFEPTSVQCNYDNNQDAEVANTEQITDTGASVNVKFANGTPGKTITCKFVNDDVQEEGKITITKAVKDGDQIPDDVKNNADFDFQILKDDQVIASFNDVGIGQTVEASNLIPGEYTVVESSLPDSWSNVSIKCGGPNGVNPVTLAGAETIACIVKNKYTPPVVDKPTLVVKKLTKGGFGKFEFSISDYPNFDLETEPGQNPKASISYEYDVDSSVTITELTSPSDDWVVQKIKCASNKGRSDEKSDGTDFIEVNNLQEGEDVVCIFTNFKETDDPGEDVTKLFIHRRVDNLLSHGPDRARVLRRLDEQPTGSLKDGGSYEPLKVAGSVKDGNTDVEFSTSLSQIRAAAASAASKQITDAGLSFNESYSGYTPYALSQRLDLWVEGQVSSYDDATGGIERDGHFGILYVGMDYALAPGVLIGGLVQFDRTRETVEDPDITGSVEGTGWMAGPYLGVKLRDDLFFDARGAWGKSSNDIDLTDDIAGHRTGSFDTDRWLATASLTGNYLYGNMRVSPQVSVEYGNEVSDDYFMSNLQKVNSVDVTIGRLTFGPEFGYKHYYENGTSIEPHMSVKGIWTFEGDELELSTGTVDLDQFRASIEGGVIVRAADGYAFRAAGSYDGIGDEDLEAWSAKLWLNIPVN